MSVRNKISAFYPTADAESKSSIQKLRVENPVPVQGNMNFFVAFFNLDLSTELSVKFEIRTPDKEYSSNDYFVLNEMLEGEAMHFTLNDVLYNTLGDISAHITLYALIDGKREEQDSAWTFAKFIGYDGGQING